MKVLIAGNLANMGYEIVQSLRKNNIDAHLLLPKYPIYTEDPKFLYPDMKEYPNWLERFDNHRNGINGWKIEVIRKMREYDIIIALAEFSIFAMFSGRPYAALSMGSDMRELPFENSLKGFLYKLSYRKAKMIIWGEPTQYNLLEKLGIKHKAVFTNVPRYTNYHPQKIGHDNFIIFHPTAQDWRLKGNRNFLLACRKLCNEFENISVILSDRGININDAKNILTGLDQIKFIPLQDAKGLQYYYNLSDIVVDEFVFGDIGMITLEAMKCGKPVLKKLDRNLLNNIYGSSPNGIINCITEEDIYFSIKLLFICREQCEELGNKNFQWADENWNEKTLSNNYVNVCNNLFQKK